MNPESDEEKEISRNVAKEYYVDAMEQQNKRGVKQAQEASDAANSKQSNANWQKELDRQNKIKLKEMEIDGKLAADPEALKNMVYNRTVLPSFNLLKNEMFDPNQGDGKSKLISEQDQKEKTLRWLESNVKDGEEMIIHKTAAEIKEEYPNAIPGNDMDMFPEGGGYYQPVSSTDYRKNILTMKDGKKTSITNPNYGEIVTKLELINEGFQINDINSIRNMLDLSGALQNTSDGKYNG